MAKFVHGLLDTASNRRELVGEALWRYGWRRLTPAFGSLHAGDARLPVMKGVGDPRIHADFRRCHSTLAGPAPPVTLRSR